MKLDSAYDTISILVQWLQYDVLQLASYPPKDREILYDFIVPEMEKITVQYHHRIATVLTALNHQKPTLLDAANTFNEKFNTLAVKHNVSLSTIWSVCYLARYAFDSIKYCEKSSALEEIFGTKYEAIEDDVFRILDGTHRCSSMVENFHSRLRPYLDPRKYISQKYLSLFQFYLNHKPFMRSAHERLENKTPAEAMTGTPHLPWLEMLGFSCFKQKTVQH